MNEFTDILTHGRRLQGAIKELSVDELKSVIVKLENIIEKRIEKEAALAQQVQEKREKAAAIRQQMLDAGLDIDDIKALSSDQPTKSTGKKRPVKYRITDADGNTTEWTGIGRTPRVFKNALDSGKSLDEFAI